MLPSKHPHVGQNRVPNMPTVLKVWNTQAHIEWLPKSPSKWEISLCHNQIVKDLSQTINRGLDMNRHTSSKLINFVRAGEQTPATRKSAGILASVKVLKMSFDLGLS